MATPRNSYSAAEISNQSNQIRGRRKETVDSGTSAGETGDSYLNLNNII